MEPNTIPVGRIELPDDLAPVGTVCVLIPAPDDPQYISMLIGLADMLKWSSLYARDPTRTGAATVARVWDDALLTRPIEVLDCEDCMQIQLRQNPSNGCQLQQSHDGGATWTLAFDYSVCQQAITLPAPYPGSPTGDDDAAAAIMRDIWKEILNIIDDTPDKPTFIAEATDKMREYDPNFANPTALGDAYDEYTSLTITEREDYNKECTFLAKKDELRDCINTDGLMDWLNCGSALMGEWLNDTSDSIMTALNQVAASMTPNSWQAAAGGGAGGGAGFGSDCGTDWVHEWDFIVSNGGWSAEPNAIGQSTLTTWVPGAGWKVAAHSGTLNFSSIKAPTTAAPYAATYAGIWVYTSGASSRYTALLDLQSGVQTEFMGGGPAAGEAAIVSSAISITVDRLVAYLRANSTLNGYITKVRIGGAGTDPY